MPGPELPGLARACQALAEGAVVVVPNPPPMTYGIVATSARALNAIKRRPLEQNVGVSLHEQSQWSAVASSIELSAAALSAAAGLMEQRFTVLLPMRPGRPPPGWFTPAVRDGYLAAFNGCWAPTARLWKEFPRLYGSSANVSGEAPADSAARAVEMFGTDCVVLDADAVDGPAVERQASTMVRIDRLGRLTLHRAGAQSKASGLGPEEFLEQLAAEVGLSRSR